MVRFQGAFVGDQRTSAISLMFRFGARLISEWQTQQVSRIDTDHYVAACRVRLRPVLMTSLATLIGLLPMAAGLGSGSEAYAPLARAIIGGLGVSVVLTVFIVPAAYLLVYRRQERKAASSEVIGPMPSPQAV